MSQLEALQRVCASRYSKVKSEQGLGEAIVAVLRYLEAWEKKWCKDWPEGAEFAHLLSEQYKEEIR